MQSQTCKKITLSQLELQSYLWLGVPVVLFLLGWFRWYIAVPVIMLLVYAVISVIERKDLAALGEGKWNNIEKDKTWKVSMALIPIITLILGMGGLVPQHFDYYFRNAVFFDIVRDDWPVNYPGDEPRVMCYYFAYWLPASLAGKITGSIFIGDIFLWIWGSWGVTILFNFLTSRLGGKVKWWYLPAIILFGYYDRIADFFLEPQMLRLFNVEEIENVYSNYMTFPLVEQIEMIFNQSIAVWIALPMVWIRRNDRASFLLPCALLFVFAPLPCVGISAAVLYRLFVAKGKLLNMVNLSAFITVTLTGIFYMSNNNASMPGQSLNFPESVILAMGIWFFLLAVGVYMPFIWHKVKREPVFWIMCVTGFVLPFATVGDSDDLGRRGMIPLFMFITYNVMIELQAVKTKSRLFQYSLYFVVITGMFACSCWFVNLIVRWDTEKILTLQAKEIALMNQLDKKNINWCYNNFIADGETIYTKWFMPERYKNKSANQDNKPERKGENQNE